MGRLIVGKIFQEGVGWETRRKSPKPFCVLQIKIFSESDE